MREESVSEVRKPATLILREDAARIIIESGVNKGKEFLLETASITIGRHADNKICLPHDGTVSRSHGRICFDKDEGVYFFEDLNSTNGTKIGKKWFRNEKVRIKHGDRIVIGKTQLRFFTKKPGLKDWLLG